jgi:hypothetical protein
MAYYNSFCLFVCLNVRLCLIFTHRSCTCLLSIRGIIRRHPIAIERIRTSDLNLSLFDILKHFSFNKVNSGYMNVSINSEAKSISSSFGM